MTKAKMAVIAGILISIAFLFQIIPVFFSETFVLVTALSAFPIYIMTRISPRLGLIGFFATAALVMLVSTHEGWFFLFANGALGLSTGICQHYTKKKTDTALIAALVLTLTLGIINYIIGVPVFGTEIPGPILIQLVILYAFSLVYSIIFLYAAKYIFESLSRFYCLEDKA